MIFLVQKSQKYPISHVQRAGRADHNINQTCAAQCNSEWQQRGRAARPHHLSIRAERRHRIYCGGVAGWNPRGDQRDQSQRRDDGGVGEWVAGAHAEQQ